MSKMNDVTILKQRLSLLPSNLARFYAWEENTILEKRSRFK